MKRKKKSLHFDWNDFILYILYYILQINIGFQRIENVEENVS